MSLGGIYDVVFHPPHLFINTELRLQKCVPIKGDMMYFLPCSKTHSSPWTKKKTALNLSPLLLPLPFFLPIHPPTPFLPHTHTHTLLYTVLNNLSSTTIVQHFWQEVQEQHVPIPGTQMSFNKRLHLAESCCRKKERTDT